MSQSDNRLADYLKGVVSQYSMVEAKIGLESDLYTQLGMDSLSFVALIVALEEQLKISIAIEEMGQCLRFGGLLKLVAKKLEGSGGFYAS